MSNETTELAEAKQIDAAVKAESAESDSPAEVRVHEDHTREMKTPGFTRMRTEWYGEDRAHMEALRAIADGTIMRLYPDAFVLIADLFEIVREPEVDEDGVVQKDQFGMVKWARTQNGAFIEDYSRLTHQNREDFLFRITANLFEWQQTRADLWGDAMFAKALWEEAFATGFSTAPGTRPTVDDKTQRGRLYAAEERYFAIFQTLLSRKADAVTSSLELLGQRLKDVLP